MRCRNCKTKFEPKQFLQKYCLETDECVKAWMASLNKQKEKEVKARHKAIKERNTNWSQVVQKDVQKIARLIDKGLPCLARGTFGQMHGGHVWAKGHFSEMRFNLHNIHRQSAYSNNYNADDALMREKLALEYGKEYGQFVDDLRNKEIPKLSNEAFRAIHLKCLDIIRRLDGESAYITPLGRIQQRNEINLELGIYDNARCVFYLESL